MAVAHRIIDRVVFIGLLVTVVGTAIPYGAVQPWWVAIFEIVIFLLGILGLLDLILTKDRLPAGASIALPLIVLCGFIVLQSLQVFGANNPLMPDLRLAISADPYTSQQVAIKLFALIVGGVLLLRYAQSESRLRTVIYTVLGVCVFTAVLGLLRHAYPGSFNWLFPMPKDAKSFAQFVNRNHFAFLIEMGLGLSLGMLVGTRSYQRLLLAAVGLLLFVALIISNSRGGIFASLCQLLLMVLLLNPFHRLGGESGSAWDRFRNIASGAALKVVLIVSLVVVFAYGVRWVGGESVVTNFELSSYSFSQAGDQGHRENISRKDIWTATWQLIKARPILGAGFGGYWIAITRYHDAAGSYSPQEAHNDYLELLASGGLVGLAIVSWFAVRFGRATVKILGSANGFARHASLAAILGILGVLIHSFVDFGLHITINAFIFSILLAIPLAGAQLVRAQSPGLVKRSPEELSPLAVFN